jgi:flagellar hook-associated protein 3 FlgL
MSMRISTGQMAQAAMNQILKNQLQLSKTQGQIASGTRVMTPSDDPHAAGQIVLLNQAIEQTNRYQVNVTRATSHIELEDGVLGSMSDGLQRVRELILQANDSSLSSADRSAIAAELGERQKELVGYANTQDTNGMYLFSGFQTTVKPYVKSSNGLYVYQGDAGQRAIAVASGINQTIVDSGQAIFENVKNGNGTFQFNAANTNTGTGVLSHYQISNSSQYIADTYTLNFVTNSAGELAYQVAGSMSGQVIPALPAVAPTDCPSFSSNQAIQFNGMEIAIDGNPAVGDQFIAKPSAQQNIFNTIGQVINALEGPQETPAARAQVSNQLNTALNALDQGLDQIIMTRTQLGARLNTIDTAKELNLDFLLNSQALLSVTQDLDLAAAAADLASQSRAMEAAQQSYVHIQNLSIFNFI